MTIEELREHLQRQITDLETLQHYLEGKMEGLESTMRWITGHDRDYFEREYLSMASTHDTRYGAIQAYKQILERISGEPSNPSPEQEWVKIGEVGVDSGQLLICDPIYIDAQWTRDDAPKFVSTLVYPNGDRKDIKVGSPEWWNNIDAINRGVIKVETRQCKPNGTFSYGACCKASDLKEKSGQLYYTKGHEGVGVAFSSGFGDGLYNVYARFEDYGECGGKRIAEVRIVCITNKARETWFSLMHGSETEEHR
jgi:hypothetical protein